MNKVKLTPATWLAAARKAAYLTGVPAHLVVGCDTGRKAVQARWKAWEEIYGDGTKYSVLSMAKASGFDHSTILNAKKRGWVASTRRGNKTNCARPHSSADGRFLAAGVR